MFMFVKINQDVIQSQFYPLYDASIFRVGWTMLPFLWVCLRMGYAPQNGNSNREIDEPVDGMGFPLNFQTLIIGLKKTMFSFWWLGYLSDKHG